MAEYINTFFGPVKSYDFFINLGSILGSVLLIFLYYMKSKSPAKAIKIFILSLVIVELGYFTGSIVRGLSYGDIRNISDVARLFVEKQGNHFIGRVLLVIWIFPPLFSTFFREIKQQRWEYLDILCIFLTFQHIFNRIACLFNGCCCGEYYNGIFALRYKVSGKNGPGYAYPVYPTQMFEIICMVLLFILLIILHIKNKGLLLTFVTGFSFTIFISEFMMNKQGVILIGGLTVIQYTAVILLISGIFLSVYKRR